MEEFCKFRDQQYKRVIKYVTNRWLSLEAAVSRTLQVFPSLTSYFLSGEDSAPRFKRLQDHFTPTMTEVCLLFYQNVLQLFIDYNLLLQREDPLIPKLLTQRRKYLKKGACKSLSIK